MGNKIIMSGPFTCLKTIKSASCCGSFCRIRAESKSHFSRSVCNLVIFFFIYNKPLAFSEWHLTCATVQGGSLAWISCVKLHAEHICKHGLLQTILLLCSPTVHTCKPGFWHGPLYVDVTCGFNIWPDVYLKSLDSNLQHRYHFPAIFGVLNAVSRDFSKLHMESTQAWQWDSSLNYIPFRTKPAQHPELQGLTSHCGFGIWLGRIEFDC